MIDQLARLPRPRASALLLSIPAMIAGSILAVAVFAPAQFAAWDAFRLVVVGAGIGLPLLGLNCQLSGAAIFALVRPGIQAASDHEAKLWAQGKKAGRRSKQMTDEAYWQSVCTGTFFAIPPLYVPLVASVYTRMDLRRAMDWAWKIELVMLGLQVVMLSLCMAGGAVIAKNAKAKAEAETAAAAA